MTPHHPEGYPPEHITAAELAARSAPILAGFAQAAAASKQAQLARGGTRSQAYEITVVAGFAPWDAFLTGTPARLETITKRLYADSAAQALQTIEAQLFDACFETNGEHGEQFIGLREADTKIRIIPGFSGDAP
jgi:hypothetical protein